MAGPGIFGFLDLTPPEEEPAPQNESRKSSDSELGEVEVPSQKAASFFPTLSTAGLLHDSDSDDGLIRQRQPGQVPQDVLAVACEPPAAVFPGLPTHVVLKVLSVQGVPLKEERNVPGHKGLGYFLEGKSVIDRSAARTSAGVAQSRAAAVTASPQQGCPRKRPQASAAILPEQQSRPPGRPASRDSP